MTKVYKCVKKNLFQLYSMTQCFYHFIFIEFFNNFSVEFALSKIS